MALSIGTITHSGHHCIGNIGILSFDFTSTVSMFGSTIYFNPAFSVDAGQLNPNTKAVPDAGFFFNITGVVTGATMQVVANGNNFLNEPLNPPAITVTSATQATIIWGNFFVEQDLNGLMTSSGQDSNTRMLTGSITNPNLDNSTPSMYNSFSRRIGLLVVLDDGAAPTGFYDDSQVIASRFYQQGLGGGAGEFQWRSFKLFRNAVEVTNLSAYEDTQAILEIDEGFNNLSEFSFHVFIYREDTITNAQKFVDDTKLSYVSGITITPFTSYNGFTSVSQFTLIAGSLYSMTITVDKDYIQDDGLYRIGVVAQDAVSPLLRNSFISASIIANAAPVAVTGTMSHVTQGLINTYDCVHTSAPLKRWAISVDVDKASYNTSLAAITSVGDFDTNFQFVVVNVRDTPTTTLGTATTQNNDPAISITDDGTTHRTTFFFRGLKEWQGLALTIEFFFYYKVTLDGGQVYFDRIFYSIPYFITFFRQDDVPVITLKTSSGLPLSKICKTDDFITVEWDEGVGLKWVANIYDDSITSSLPLEHDDFTPSFYEKLATDVMEFDESALPPTKRLKIYPSLLAAGGQYCLGLTSVDTTQFGCPTITTQFAFIITSTGNLTNPACTATLFFNHMVLAGQTIESQLFEFTVTPSGSGGTTTSSTTQTNPVIPYNYDGLTGGTITYRFKLSVTMTTGCRYEYLNEGTTINTPSSVFNTIVVQNPL